MKNLRCFAQKLVTVPRISALVGVCVILLIAAGAYQNQSNKQAANAPTEVKTTTQASTNVQQEAKPVTPETPAPKPENTTPAATNSTKAVASQTKPTTPANTSQTNSPTTIVVIPQIMASSLTLQSDPVCTLTYTFDLSYAKFAYVPAGVTQEPKNLTSTLTATFGPSYDIAPASVTSSFVMAPGSLAKTMQININKASDNGGTYIEFPVILHLLVSSSTPNVSFVSGNTFTKDIPAQCH